MNTDIENYDNRFVAFIDILGFKSIIENTARNALEYKRIKNVLTYIAQMQEDNYYGFLAQYGILKEISIFSDSIVISYSRSLSIGGALFHILVDLVHLCNDLLCANIFVRGGIAYGQMYHDKHICFGPAMIKAYKMEEETAVFPRIVIDREAIEMGIRYPGQANTSEQECEYLKDLLCEDDDGFFFLDYLSQFTEFNDIQTYRNYLERVKKFVTMHLAANHIPNVHQKYVWFADYFNQTLKKIYGNQIPPNMIIDVQE